MMSWFSRMVLSLCGMKIAGDVRRDLPKKIYAVVPHTSAWDFPLGLLVRSAKKMKVNFVGKKSLFKPPLGILMRWLGGEAVDRAKSGNKVRSIANIFIKSDEFTLAIAPEGTRQKVDRLKTGFYHIAKLAEVPIIPVKFDFGTKTVTFGDVFYPTDDKEQDMAYFDDFFKDAKGYYPELSYNPTLQP